MSEAHPLCYGCVKRIAYLMLAMGDSTPVNPCENCYIRKITREEKEVENEL